MLIDNAGKPLIAVDNTRQTLVSKPMSGGKTALDAAGFASILKTQVNYSEQVSQKNDTLLMSPNLKNHTTLQATDSPTIDTIKLGSLSGNNKSVAQLLLNNPELKAKTWSIIHNPVNRNKAFNQIAAGKTIYFNQKTQELHWSDSRNTRLLNPSAINLDQDDRTTGVAQTAQTKHTATSDTGQKLVLGQINQTNPTISNLLSQQNHYRSQRWDIIHSEVNKDKEFTKIPTDTVIYIDSKTKELSWNQTAHNNVVENTDNKKILAEKLDDAVKPFMGTEYKHLDCYTLVVNGLENMGIRYRGKGSISSQLLQRAELDGRSSHAYFTGEGLTEALGNKVYTKAISKIENIPQQSQSVFQEMKNLMQKGDILSFSLKTRGHTGIISHNNEQWTYINSGRMDHSISNSAPRHGVGEESLLSEINNWIKLAQKNNEALQITVGRLDKQKLA